MRLRHPDGSKRSSQPCLQEELWSSVKACDGQRGGNMGIRSSGDPSGVKEPPGLTPDSALRPDGATVIPWSGGRCLAWDVTCPDTVAASYVVAGASTAGAAAENAASLKSQKYHQLSTTHSFSPLVFETFVPLVKRHRQCLTVLGVD